MPRSEMAMPAVLGLNSICIHTCVEALEPPLEPAGLPRPRQAMAGPEDGLHDVFIAAFPAPPWSLDLMPAGFGGAA